MLTQSPLCLYLGQRLELEPEELADLIANIIKYESGGLCYLEVSLELEFAISAPRHAEARYSIDQGSPCPLASLNPFGRELLLSDVFAGLKRPTRIKRIL
jgi:hypothetical protein